MAVTNILLVHDGKEPDLTGFFAQTSNTIVHLGQRPSDFGDAISEASVLFHWSGSRDAFRQIYLGAQNLKWIHIRLAGVDALLFEELLSAPLLITNGRGVFGPSLGEFAILSILYFAKDVPRLRRQQAAARWEPYDMLMIEGKTLGIVGYGNIGQNVAKRACALGMKVLACKRSVSTESEPPSPLEMIYSADRLLEMLRRCDYVVVATPLTPETRHMIGRDALAAMKQDAILINIGRGAVVDECALIEALTSHSIKGAALDVFEREPLPSVNPLFGLEHVLLSPHCADNHADWLRDSMQFFIDQYIRFSSGQALSNLVQKDLGY